MKFTSLKLLLPAAFLASILTFTLGYSLVLFNGMRTTLQDQAYDTAALLSKEAALRVQGQIDAQSLKLQSFIQNHSTAGIDGLGAASRAAVTQSARTSGLSELALVTASGDVIYSTLPANLDGALRNQIANIANQARQGSSARCLPVFLMVRACFWRKACRPVAQMRGLSLPRSLSPSRKREAAISPSLW